MGSNFKIFKHRKRGSLHLQLTGKIDDISICELIDVLKTDCLETNHVFIHMDNIDHVSISGIGRDVFRRNITNLTDNAVHIKFTGDANHNLAAECGYS